VAEGAEVARLDGDAADRRAGAQPAAGAVDAPPELREEGLAAVGLRASEAHDRRRGGREREREGCVEVRVCGACTCERSMKREA